MSTTAATASTAHSWAWISSSTSAGRRHLQLLDRAVRPPDRQLRRPPAPAPRRRPTPPYGTGRSITRPGAKPAVVAVGGSGDEAGRPERHRRDGERGVAGVAHPHLHLTADGLVGAQPHDLRLDPRHGAAPRRSVSLDDGRGSDGRRRPAEPPQPASSTAARAIAVRLMAPEPRAPARSPVSWLEAGEHPAGLHAHLELLLRVGRRPAPRLAGRRGRTPTRATGRPGTSAPRTSSTVPSSSGPARCEQAATKTSTRAPRRTTASGTATLRPLPVRRVGRPSGQVVERAEVDPVRR